MANLKNCTRLYFDENWTLVVQASPDAGATSFVVAAGELRQTFCCSENRLLIEEQLVIAKVRLVHLSVKIPVAQKRHPFSATNANFENKKMGGFRRRLSCDNLVKFLGISPLVF